MKITVPRSSGPSAEPDLLIRFVMHKCTEVLAQNRKKLPTIWTALALAAVSDDPEFYDRLKKVISSSSNHAEKILSLCKDTFVPGLDRLQNGYTPENPDEEGEYHRLGERACRPVLSVALGEAKRMIASVDYEFVRIFAILVWIGLQCYPARLYQWEAVCQSYEDDPQHLLQIGIEIIRAALVSSRKEK